MIFAISGALDFLAIHANFWWSWLWQLQLAQRQKPY
jgi:hypothetical protein